MSDGNEGDGEAAAEEQDEHGGQPVAVVNSEWQVLKNKQKFNTTTLQRSSINVRMGCFLVNRTSSVPIYVVRYC